LCYNELFVDSVFNFRYLFIFFVLFFLEGSFKAQTLHPTNGSTGVYEDEELSITFDSEHSLGSGQVTIYDASNDATVDTIKISGETNTYGQRSLSVGSQLIYKDSKKIGIIPHSGKLTAGKQYYVGVPSTVVSGYAGFNPTSKTWVFTVRSKPSAGSSITVAKSGSSTFRSVQGALTAASSGSGAVSVEIDTGTYREDLDWRATREITIKAKSGVANTAAVIAFENCDGLNSGTSGRPLFLINQNTPAVIIQGITIENTRVKTGTGDQAETIYLNGASGYLIVKNCRLISRQDTLLLKGYSYFYNCYITGDVDFIWGTNDLTLFDSCQINARVDNRAASTVSYVLQARSIAKQKGFVFLNCNFTADSSRTGTVYMARTNGAGSSSSSDGWDSVAIIKSRVDTSKYNTTFWYAGSKTIYPTKGTANTGFREYGNVDTSGKELSTSGRNSANYVLSQSEYNSNYATVALVVSGTPLANHV
jgi:pectin methylesterase-like acyl-CoA thioesterase